MCFANIQEGRDPKILRELAGTYVHIETLTHGRLSLAQSSLLCTCCVQHTYIRTYLHTLATVDAAASVPGASLIRMFSGPCLRACAWHVRVLCTRVRLRTSRSCSTTRSIYSDLSEYLAREPADRTFHRSGLCIMGVCMCQCACVRSCVRRFACCMFCRECRV